MLLGLIGVKYGDEGDKPTRQGAQDSFPPGQTRTTYRHGDRDLSPNELRSTYPSNLWLLSGAHSDNQSGGDDAWECLEFSL